MKRQIGKRFLPQVLFHRRNRTGKISILLVEHERHDAISRMPPLASGLVNEYAQLPSDGKTSHIQEVPGDTPGHLVEAKSLRGIYTMRQAFSRCAIR